MFLYRIVFMFLFIGFFTNNALAASKVSQRTKLKLQSELPILGLKVGNKLLIRTFKKESRLELWMKPSNKIQFILFRTYPICYHSGGLGPKMRTGDKVTPEGFYSITRKGLNPHSRFHLSMNIGYPNRYDRAHGRTGALLMIHGACDAVGCFAMGNDQIEEIYYLVEQALNKSQKSIPVHSFPFHMKKDYLSKMKAHKWYHFWSQLKPAYDTFEASNIPPKISVKGKRYIIQE